MHDREGTSGFLALTPVQEGMVFHQLTNGINSGVDIEQIVCELQHSVDIGVFQRCWEIFLDQNPELRSRIDLDAARLRQEIGLDIKCEVAFVDWSSDGNDIRSLDDRFQSFLDKDRQVGFDIATAPLFRIHLIKYGNDLFRCIWTFHHLLMDGRSFALALTDLFTLYDELLSGERSKSEARPPRSTYLSWRENLDWSDSLPYWQNLLGDVGEISTLRPATSKSESDDKLSPKSEVKLVMSDSTSAKIRSWAEKQSVTVNSVIQAAWAILNGRYSGAQSVVFGTTRSGRKGTVENADEMIGVFITTVPVRADLAGVTTKQLVENIRQQHIDVRKHEHTPLPEIQNAATIGGGSNLFETLIIFDRQDLDSTIHLSKPDWTNRRFWFLERAPYPFTLYVFEQPQLRFTLAFDAVRLSPDEAIGVLSNFSNLLDEITQQPEVPLIELQMHSKTDYSKLVAEYNDTAAPISKDCIHDLIEQQSKRIPDADCVISGNSTISYGRLAERSDQIASELQKMGVKPGSIVGICIDRSIDMVASIIGTMKAGAAYLPMDPNYPAGRMEYCMSDSGADVLVTSSDLAPQFSNQSAKILTVDQLKWSAPSTPPLKVDINSSDLAYLIYTSGSTGEPKGVMVEHRNVVNFFSGMDDIIKTTERKRWLAVTSLAFDISVLELLWTLSRGFTVVLAGGTDNSEDDSERRRKIGFSLFYFASDPGGVGREKYDLVLKGAEFADQHGFDAIWTPERHFHKFGGLYPNPSVIGAAVAAITKNIGIRAGSVVLPLHHPLRVVEEWSIVDNLSNGKVGLSFASGWQPNDFVLAPERYESRRESLAGDIDTVRRLWRGESLSLKNPKGDMVEVTTLPRPVQAELPIWVTAAGSPETFRQAGEIGANLLTHLLGQTLNEVREKVEIYRQAWRDNGHGADGGHVSLMLHTMIGIDNDAVREQVRQPMKNYLRSAASLVAQYADAWTAYKQGSGNIDEKDFNDLNEEEMDSLLDFAFERYFETSALFGTPEKCAELVDSVHDAGVDEIACLIDFGVEHSLVLDNLKHLNSLKVQSHRRVTAKNISVSDLILQHDISHVQCTPSGARTILNEEHSAEALASIDQLLVGGEAFPLDLWRDLDDCTKGDVVNMYGPTETTIWSTASVLGKDSNVVPIGQPIANTQVYVLDPEQRLTPIGTPGELYIGGEGVARGYCGRAELSNERFIHDSFSAKPDQKMYRTGDIVSWGDDRNLHFLGRVDHQVKIRGFRVELGEIETRLAEYEPIQQAVVIAHADSDGTHQLVAYCKPFIGAEIAPQSVIAHLAKSLPEYMVPSQILIIDEFPLTPNKKVDRKKLPDPAELFKTRAKAASSIPATDLEETIRQIWESVLGVSPISIQDNFFDIGGHSLRAVQVQNKLRIALDTKIPITNLFRFPTIAAFAANIQGEIPVVSGLVADRAKRRRAARSKRRS